MSAIYPQELPSQDFFEGLLGRSGIDVGLTPRLAPLVIVYFTARWCGACKRVDIPKMVSLRGDAVWYKCDVDDNTYTPGYCGVNRIPAFLALIHGKAQPVLLSSDNIEIAKFLSSGQR